MKNLVSICVLAVLTLWTCNKEETIVLSTCSDGNTYAIDYRPTFFQDSRIWLTEADGDVGFDEPLSFATFGLQFLNFDDACEDEYTISFANYIQGSGSSPAWIAQNLTVDEYDQVPNGSILDERGASLTFGTVVNFQPESQIVVSNCPPIDSVEFWLNSGRDFEGNINQPYIYEYYPEDSVLVVTTDPVQVTATDVTLAVRREEDGAWLGHNYMLAGSQFDGELPYAELGPLEARTIPVSWPENAVSVELELRLITSAVGQRNNILSFGTEREDAVTVLVDPLTQGPLLVTAAWTDGARFEMVRVYEQWPTQIDISTQIEATIGNYNYPSLELTTSGANIAVIAGTYVRPEESEFCFRNFTTPLEEGTQTIRFPNFSPRLRNDQLDRVYEGALQENTVINFYHYPGMNGSYSWYLRNVHSQQGTGQTWLESLEYERLIVPL